MRTRMAVVAALAVTVLAGCAGGDGAADGTPSPEERMTGHEPTPPPGSPSPATPPPGATSPEAAAPGAGASPAAPRATPLRPPRSKPAPTVSEGELTVTGQVVEGVEPGCLLLLSGASEYLLVVSRDVDRSALRPGAEVTVRGRLEPNLLSTCQQGTPFIVTEVRSG